MFILSALLYCHSTVSHCTWTSSQRVPIPTERNDSNAGEEAVPQLSLPVTLTQIWGRCLAYGVHAVSVKSAGAQIRLLACEREIRQGGVENIRSKYANQATGTLSKVWPHDHRPRVHDNSPHSDCTIELFWKLLAETTSRLYHHRPDDHSLPPRTVIAWC